nr:immunoglobulin light chain junction region [Macaca mulatta]MOV84081.1 immunoglobulin light chain junction region [Macaca mulatta]
CQQYITSPFTF